MFKIEVDASDVMEKFMAMSRNFENFPRHMEDEFRSWQTDDMNRSQPDIGRPDRHSVDTRLKARGGRKSASERLLQRQRRRFIRRITPAPLRRLRRFARIGRKPERVLYPAPIRQYRRMKKQVKAIVAGKPRAIGRIIRPVGAIMRARRRAILRLQMWEALTERMGSRARNNLSW